MTVFTVTGDGASSSVARVALVYMAFTLTRIIPTSGNRLAFNTNPGSVVNYQKQGGSLN